MGSSTRAEISAAFASLRASVSGLLELSFDALTTPERLGFLQNLEDEYRRLPVARHALINQLTEQASESELGGKLGPALAERLRISIKEAHRRIAEAADLGHAGH